MNFNESLRKEKLADQYVFPSWISRVIGSKLVCIRLSNEITGVLKNGFEVQVPWPSTIVKPRVHKGIFFYKVQINQDIGLNFLTRKQAQVATTKILSRWYVKHLPSFSNNLKLIQSALSANYIRSSKLPALKTQVDMLVGKFHKPPKKGFLPENTSNPYLLLYDLREHFDDHVAAARNKFVSTECKKFKSYFDSIESNPLTPRQRIACVVDDDNNLVLAGAGTGKTSVMVAKAGYLVESGRANPEDILLLAFGRKAARELDERIEEKLNTTRIQASTFHGLGRHILQEVEKRAITPSELATDTKRFQKFVDHQLNSLLDDEGYADIAIRYFEQYLYPIKNILDFESQREYIDYLKNNEIRSLKGELVKSYGELLIANFLFTNGIEYKYEEKYKIDVPGANFKSYTPDFYLPEYDIYIEHFGVDRDGNTAPWINKQLYQKDMEWKRQLHAENGTVMLETFYYQQVEGKLFDILEAQLAEKDVVFSPLPNESIFETLKEFGRMEALSKLFADLITNIKSCCISDTEVEARARHSCHPEHALAALDLLKPIMAAYDTELDGSQKIDFNDMIHKALQYLEQGRFTPSWKYILVDEFQDISDPRARLIKALRDKVEGCSVVCVGDDWQSIYRFTGSDLRFTTEFRKLFGAHSTSTLDRTFRFNNMIGAVASKFVSENPSQVRKDIKSHTQVEKPAVSIFKTDNCSGISEIRAVIHQIASDAKTGSSVFVLSRFKHLLPKEYYQLKKEYSNLDIKAGMTMHASKGKEADYVIVVGVEKGMFGFPSEKETHPLLEVYLPDQEAFINAEERRLFYVAITRAKHKTYILANMKNASAFATELLSKNYDVVIDEFPTDPSQENIEEFTCPNCESGTLIERSKKEDGSKFTGCNNYPYCDYTRKNCEWCNSKLIDRGAFLVCESDACEYKTKVCDRCNSGVMVTRTRGSDGKKFWGCSNHRGSNANSCRNSYNYIDFS